MDSPRGVPESSSPVVLLPASSQFSYGVNRTEVATTTTGSRTLLRHTGITQQPRTTRTIASVASSSAAIRTNGHFAGGHGGDTAVAGPTTRSRKRSHNNAREASSAQPDAAPSSSASPPSTKRKSPTATRGSRSKRPRSASSQKKPPPEDDLKKAPCGCTKAGEKDEASDKKPAAAVVNCCICMCDVEPSDLAMINGCDHRFCFGCIEKWSERENKCPLCKARFTKIDRINKKRKKGTKNTKKVKQRDQRSDLAPGAALEGLIANLNRNSGLARIILGGFEFGGISASGPPTARASFTTRSSNGMRSPFEDEDSDDDDSPMAAFMRALHGSSVANGVSMSTTVVRPMTLTAHFSTTTRSFARNVHDSTAGNGADNPLEIDDDSVEEVIEID